MLLMALWIVLCAPGCDTPPPAKAPTTQAPSEIPAGYHPIAGQQPLKDPTTQAPPAKAPIAQAPIKNGSGTLLEDAQQKSKKLLPDMPQEEVRTLLGEPDETAATTFGSATAHPWNGVIWMYRWHTDFRYDPYRVNQQPNFTWLLQIVFEKSNDGWVVNSWNWSR